MELSIKQLKGKIKGGEGKKVASVLQCTILDYETP